MPFRAWVPVERADGTVVASLDCREFARGAKEASAALARCGLFRREVELTFDVLEHFRSGPELLEVVAAWGRTRIPAKLADAVRHAEEPFRVRERVRLGRWRAIPA